MGDEIIAQIVSLMDKLDNNNVKKLHGIVESEMFQRQFNESVEKYDTK